MVGTIDWAMVSSWAALVTAAGAVVSLWIQNRHARVTRSLDIFLRLEAKYDSERMKEIQKEILFENFYHSILAYWFTAKKLIVDLRRENKELYDHFEFLAEQDLVYARKKTGEGISKLQEAASWRYFMERESHAS